MGRVTVVGDHPLRRLLGVVRISGDTTTMVSESDSVVAGSVVTVLPMDGKRAQETFKVLERLGPMDPRDQPVLIYDSRQTLWWYRLGSPARRESSVRFGLGVVDLHDKVRRTGVRLAADLDGDGATEVVTRCTDDGSLRLLVRMKREHRLLWGAVCWEKGLPVERTCTEEDLDLN